MMHTEKETILVIVEICRPCSNQIFKSEAKIRQRIITYQLRKAAQLWLLEVIHFAVETIPFPSCLFLLLLAGICVQLTRVLVERKTRYAFR